MISAEIPSNEAERLQALFDYEILDTPEEEAFDQLTDLASSICGTPIALVSLIDEHRQWFKSHHGLAATETPRELAFCAHAIHQDTIFEVSDSRTDERFHDNPLVTENPNVVFYAGAPLTTAQGLKLGTLCVIDNKPSQLSELQKKQLNIIAQQVVTQLELRKSNRAKEALFQKLVQLNKKTERRSGELNAFSTRAAHDLKSPIARIMRLADFCIEDIKDNNQGEAIGNCETIIRSCTAMQVLIEDIFALSRADISTEKSCPIDMQSLISETLEALDTLNQREVSVIKDVQISRVFVSEAVRVKQIIYNLASNAIKYAHPKREDPWVRVKVEDTNGGIRIEVADNGVGIPAHMHTQTFTMFERFNPELAEGTGLGLAIVKKHVDTLEGAITFTSDDSGSVFSVELPNAFDRNQ